MKVTFHVWGWSLPLCAALVCGGQAWAQQPSAKIELAEPTPAVKEGTAADAEVPTPAQVPIPGVAPTAPTPLAPAPATPAGEEAASVAKEPTLPEKPKAVPLAPLAADKPAEDDAAIEWIQERYASGALKLEREMTLDADGNYVPHGDWRQYDEQGRLIAEGRFIHNHREGNWRRLYRGTEAPLLATLPYREFIAPLLSQASFERGQMHGKWTIVDARQRKIHEIEFSDGERHGKAFWYYPNGATLLESHYDHGRVTGDVIMFTPDSEVAARESYQNGRKLAAKVEYYDAERQIKRQEMTYLYGTLIVKTPDNWDTVALATFETSGQDERHGPFTMWHPNGQIAREGEFRYNVPVGKVVYWHANGQKQMEGTYADGRQEGIWSWWHTNGLKSVVGEYHDGTPSGLWSWWQASGQLAQRTDLTSEESGDRQAKRQLAEPILELR